jgi:virginiamycin B lyase
MRNRLLLLGITACLAIVWSAGGSAAPLAGRGVLSGTVTAPQAFQAARVYARHVEKNVIFMVYSVGGRFQTVNLFPGAYEVWAEKEGFDSDVQQITIEAGKAATVAIPLRAGKGARRSGASTGGMMGGGAPREGEVIEELPYDQLFPNEPGRAVLERSCIVCHGENFISRAPRSPAAWDTAIKMMTGEGKGMERWGTPILPLSTFTPAEWQALRDYLGKHFNENAPKRSLKVARTAMPIDEQALANAQWIEYRLPWGPYEGKKRERRAQEPNFDERGNVWFTERGGPGGGVGMLDPRTATVKDYPHPDAKIGDAHGLVADKDGFLWFAGQPDYLSRLHMGTGEISRYSSDKPGWGHTPVLDSKGNVWVSALAANKIGFWNKATNKVVALDIPNDQGRPYGILIDKQDHIWFAEFHGCQITKYEPETKKFTSYQAKTRPCRIRRLGMDPDGNVWYGGNSTGMIGRVDAKTGAVTEWKMPAQPSQPYDVWPDAAGNIWITDDGPMPSAFVKFEPKTAKFTYYPSVQQADMPKVAIAQDGGIWYSPRSGVAAVGVFYPDVTKMEDTPRSDTRVCHGCSTGS